MEQNEHNKFDYSTITEEIDGICDQLCLSVRGEYDFVVNRDCPDEHIQKLCMLINFLLDTTRRNMAELTNKNEQLNKLDRLKSDFIANVSHELRTPLTLILAPLENIMSESTSLSEENQRNLGRVQRNASRLFNLVNTLLDFSKAEANKYTFHKQAIDMCDLVSQITDDAQTLANDRDIKLSFKSCEDLGIIYIDPDVIEKITLNLLGNALKFTPAGGSVEVGITHSSHILELYVTDTGEGIPEEQIEFLFERFHQVDSSISRKYEGTGIGLALVKNFVTQMHGTIDVKSQLKKGSTFRVRLPIERPPAEEQVNNVATPKQTRQRKAALTDARCSQPSETTTNKVTQDNMPLILVTDDNADMRGYICSLLDQSYRTIQAENGQQALKIAREQKPQVIISDVMMPVMDGHQLTQAIKSDEDLQHIPIILITARAGKEAVIQAIDIGADDYLPKPFKPEELIARAKSAIRLNESYDSLVKQKNEELAKINASRIELQSTNQTLSSQLLSAARRAGMADVATSILHNVGNILNSITVSLDVVRETLTKSKILKLKEISNLISEHKEDLGAYVTEDQRGKLIPEYLEKLAIRAEQEHRQHTEELKSIMTYVQHVKDVISTQNSISCTAGFNEPVSLPELMETSLKMADITHNRYIRVIKNYNYDPHIILDKTKTLQILVNLIQNAVDALNSCENNDDRVLTLIIEPAANAKSAKIHVQDNGMGISPEAMEKMFTFGFTTKKTGHGFGLHASVLTAREMGGDLEVTSEGLGRGCTFSLTLVDQSQQKNTERQ